MKVLFTGGGTGGHFFPIIAITQRLNEKINDMQFGDVDIYYMSNDPYNKQLLNENGIIFQKIIAGKLRRYFSIKNISDFFLTLAGTFIAIWKMFKIYPDVVVGKGGYASFPALLAARLLLIPVIIHESDIVPGRVNKWAGKFAERIGVAYPETVQYFDSEKCAHVGNPIRREIMNPLPQGATEYLSLEHDTPVVMILGGSQGAQKINDAILPVISRLVNKYQIIHQVGMKNLDDVRATAGVALSESPHKERYKIFGFLNDISMKMAAGVTDLVVTRAGSTIFEIALWGIPSIIIPIPEEISHDQRKNAFTYARSGAAVVIEERNLSPNLLASEIDRLMSSGAKLDEMNKAAKNFARSDAADKMADQITAILERHSGVVISPYD